jgi:hypothetical protein
MGVDVHRKDMNDVADLRLARSRDMLRIQLKKERVTYLHGVEGFTVICFGELSCIS